MPDCPGPKAFYLTTPIYYVNDAPHIGHAYTTVAGDMITRWHRQRQEDVWFLTGTDEHGQKVLRTAEANGVTPQEWADRLVEESWKPVLATLDATNDDFIRTTEPRHVERVQRFLQGLYDRGDIYAGSYEGPYCVGCEEYKLPGDLLAGVGEYEGQQMCPIHGTPVEMVAEQNYFFRMSAYAERLMAHFEANPTFVQPASARNEIMSFVAGGLQDLSISRSTFDWGVPLPWDTSHVFYVWFDALLNYVTAVGLGSDDPADQELFARTWPADVHLVGKDILRFHAAIWPAMLMAAELPLPKQIFAHGWLLVGGEKMSKSKLTGIAPSQITDTFGSDAFRYYFMRAISFGQDGSFSWEDLSARYQSELANGFGNLASRVIAMVMRYCDGVVPDAGEFTAEDLAIQATEKRVTEAAGAAIDKLAIHDALSTVWELVDELNGYITLQEPWALAKDPQARVRLETVLHTAVRGLGTLAVLLSPVIPVATGKLWAALGGDGPLAEQRVDRAWEWTGGVRVTALEPLFPRIESIVEPTDG